LLRTGFASFFMHVLRGFDALHVVGGAAVERAACGGFEDDLLAAGTWKCRMP